MTKQYLTFLDKIQQIKGKGYDNGNGCTETESIGYGDQADR
jgi:hypothetical protein